MGITDIRFATRTVGYLSVITDAGAGKIYRTIDGGNSWVAVPELGGNAPSSDAINAIATCWDPNLAIGVGLAQDGVDGIVVVAKG